MTFPYRQFPHAYAGSNAERQSVGDPGHCADCVTSGHVVAHPELGCGDVGCVEGHAETERKVPALPPLHFFRVYRASDSMLVVEIRRERPARKSKRVVDVAVIASDNPVDDVARGYERAAEALAQKIDDANYWAFFRRHLEGDH